MEAKAVKNASSLLQFSGHSELETGLHVLLFCRPRYLSSLMTDRPPSPLPMLFAVAPDAQTLVVSPKQH